MRAPGQPGRLPESSPVQIPLFAEAPQDAKLLRLAVKGAPETRIARQLGMGKPGNGLTELFVPLFLIPLITRVSAGGERVKKD